MPRNQSQRPNSTRRGAAEFLRAYEARQEPTVEGATTTPQTAFSAAQAQQKLRVGYEILKNSAASDALGKDKVYLEIVSKSAGNEPVHPLLAAHVCRLENTQDAIALHFLSDAFAAGHCRNLRSTGNHRDGTASLDIPEHPTSCLWMVSRAQMAIL
jgi:hypothetical protein